MFRQKEWNGAQQGFCGPLNIAITEATMIRIVRTIISVGVVLLTKALLA